MIQTCNEEYWRYMQSSKPADAPCGRTYDDVDHWTFCPHDPLPPRPTEAQLQEAFDQLNAERLQRGYEPLPGY